MSPWSFFSRSKDDTAESEPKSAKSAILPEKTFHGLVGMFHYDPRKTLKRIEEEGADLTSDSDTSTENNPR